ncbi:MAG: hypothetical protein U9N60_00270 [Thermodesulfobacteriota bacterium]|nr:hypothetical protein [Thermodesulfobacteriota bacterium]
MFINFIGLLMMNHNQYMKEPVALEMVEEYLLADQYGSDIIPKRVNPELLMQFLRKRVNADSPAWTILRATDLVAFYGLRAMVPHFSMLLESEDAAQPDFSKSLSIVMMMAYVGDQSDCKKANNYFQNHLLKHHEAHKNLRSLLICWTALGPQSSPLGLKSIIQSRREFLKSEVHKSDNAYIKFQQLHRLANNDLPRAEKAMSVRREIESEKNAAQLKRIIAIYSGMNPAFRDFLFRWSAYRILREAEKGEEERGRVIHAMRSALNECRKDKKLNDNMKRFMRIRLLRAIEYFDPRELSDEERTVLHEALEQGQDDLISTVQPYR